MQHASSISIATHPRHIVVIGTAQPSFRSLDNGASWARLKSSPSGGSDFMFAGADSTRLYGATGIGLFLSTDAGDTWTRAAGALGHVQITALGSAVVTDHTIVYAATTGGRAGTTSPTTAVPRAAAAAASTMVGAGVYRYVLVPTPKVTLKLSGLKSGALRLGRRVTAKGVVTPSRLAGSKVKLSVQKKRSGRWVTRQERAAGDRSPRSLWLDLQARQQGRLSAAGHDREDGDEHGCRDGMAPVQGEVAGATRAADHG